MRSLLLLLALGLAVCLGGGVAAADTNTAAVGDQGGSPFGLKCKAGTALEGFAYGGGSGWSFLEVFCQPVVEGTLAGYPSGGQSIGDHGGGKAPDSSCDLYDPTMVITGISVYLDEHAHVDQVRATCHVISGNKAGVLLGATGPGPGAPTGPHKGEHCEGSYAVGLIGTYSGVVNSLGLICHGSGDATPQTQPQDTTPSGPPHRDNSGAVTAAVDTTVYSKPDGDEIAYLNAGDPVTLISCKDKGKGWCKIGAPKKGYVWGPDLAQ